MLWVNTVLISLVLCLFHVQVQWSWVKPHCGSRLTAAEELFENTAVPSKILWWVNINDLFHSFIFEHVSLNSYFVTKNDRETRAVRTFLFSCRGMCLMVLNIDCQRMLQCLSVDQLAAHRSKLPLTDPYLIFMWHGSFKACSLCR